MMAQVSFHILLKAGVDEFPLSVHLVSDELEQLSSEVSLASSFEPGHK